MAKEFVKSVLVLVIGFALKYVFGQIGLELDEATYNAIVGAIVAYLLAMLGMEGLHRAAPTLF